MEPLRHIEAVALPMPRANVDTDQILPARFLSKPRRDGCGDYLFRDLRFRSGEIEDPDFPLNWPSYRGARIIVASHNFGCGSSRENAVWALYDFGFRIAVAPSFGDIFFNNCLKNGFLPVVLEAALVARTIDALIETPGTSITLDLTNQTVKLPGESLLGFDINPFAKHCLLNGVDEIGYTLGQVGLIADFERRAAGDAV
jgi:3-isopropylmalate/(R)-2-methylmalate dehydratase small subunit